MFQVDFKTFDFISIRLLTIGVRQKNLTRQSDYRRKLKVSIVGEFMKKYRFYKFNFLSSVERRQKDRTSNTCLKKVGKREVT